MMKRIFLILFFSISAFAQPDPHYCIDALNVPDFGKTHFIVGLPTHELRTKKETIPCPAGSLVEQLRCADGSFRQAFFSPDDDLQGLLLELIGTEQKAIRVAIFSFTDGELAQALIEAHRKGISVTIVTDASSVKDKFNKIGVLKKEGVRVYVYDPINTTILNNIMHNKFVLFEKNIEGKSLLVTGSFNWTKSARINNQENILIVDTVHIVERYNKQFAILIERSAKKEVTKLADRKKRFITTIPS